MMVLNAVLVVTTGLPTAPVGVMVSILKVTRVIVPGSVAVAVMVTVDCPPLFPPGVGIGIVPGVPGNVTGRLKTPVVAVKDVLVLPAG